MVIFLWHIVPHAYNHINLFYINPQIALYRMFQFDTPAYGLARRRGQRDF